MNKKILIFIIYTLFVLFSFSKASTNENKILFKINNSSFTSYDFKIRKEYLKLVGDNSKLDSEIMFDDFVSANIFYEFHLEKKIIDENELNTMIDKIYTQITNESNLDVLKYLDERKIKLNLKIDYIRKIILENFLNKEKNEIFNEKNEIELLYNFNIKYLNIFQSDLTNIKNKIEDNIFNNINEVEDFLKENKINFFKKEREINDINLLRDIINKNLYSNKNFFIIEESDYISFISIERNFETFDGLIASILSFETYNRIDRNNLTCKNINNNSLEVSNIEKKEYEYSKLNQTIKDNLIKINDYMEFNNEEKYLYVLLCDVKFNKETLNNISINKEISNSVKKIEDKFVKDFTKKYKVIFLNE